MYVETCGAARHSGVLWVQRVLSRRGNHSQLGECGCAPPLRLEVAPIKVEVHEKRESMMLKDML